MVRAGLPFESLTLDLRSNARVLAQSLNDHHIIWVSTLRSNARITYRGRPQPVAEWAKHLPRHRIAGRPWAWVGTVPFPRNGTVRLVVSTNGQGGLADIVSNDLHRRGKVLLHQERSRAHQDQLPRHQAAGWARSVSAPGAAGYKAARRFGPPGLRGLPAATSRPIRNGGRGQTSLASKRHPRRPAEVGLRNRLTRRRQNHGYRVIPANNHQGRCEALSTLSASKPSTSAA